MWKSDLFCSSLILSVQSTNIQKQWKSRNADETERDSHTEKEKLIDIIFLKNYTSLITVSLQFKNLFLSLWVYFLSSPSHRQLLFAFSSNPCANYLASFPDSILLSSVFYLSHSLFKTNRTCVFQTCVSPTQIILESKVAISIWLVASKMYYLDH